MERSRPERGYEVGASLRATPRSRYRPPVARRTLVLLVLLATACLPAVDLLECYSDFDCLGRMCQSGTCVAAVDGGDGGVLGTDAPLNEDLGFADADTDASDPMDAQPVDLGPPDTGPGRPDAGAWSGQCMLTGPFLVHAYSTANTEWTVPIVWIPEQAPPGRFAFAVVDDADVTLRVKILVKSNTGGTDQGAPHTANLGPLRSGTGPQLAIEGGTLAISWTQSTTTAGDTQAYFASYSTDTHLPIEAAAPLAQTRIDDRVQDVHYRGGVLTTLVLADNDNRLHVISGAPLALARDDLWVSVGGRLASDGAGLFGVVGEREVSMAPANREVSFGLWRTAQQRSPRQEISDAGGGSGFAAVAYNRGTNEFGVVWTDERNTMDGQIFFARVSRVDGMRIGAEIPVIAGELADVVYSEPLARYGVTYVAPGNSGDGDVYFLLVDAEGQIVHGPVQLSDTPNGSLGPRITWDDYNDEFAVAWYDHDAPGGLPGAYFRTIRCQ